MKPLLALSVLCLAACDRPGAVNPPTEPAQPVQGPIAAAPPAQRPPGAASMLPGAGPVSFVGRWAAKAEWCAQTTGEGRAIEITTTEFSGYENRCAIVGIDEQPDGYQATLSCDSEGVRMRERVRFVATAETLNLTWLDRGTDQPVLLIRCTSLAG
ncbi:hypothetical protein ABC365_03035 [Brevundimonas sp. 3P9-tot-E]|uniref:hypothetical protein n=1 Tax=Brevundimonas TaxID=41275 RepID=UPI0034D6DD79